VRNKFATVLTVITVIAAAAIVDITNAPSGRAQSPPTAVKAQFEVASVRRAVLQPPSVLSLKFEHKSGRRWRESHRPFWSR
jgi:hypothetical protein